MYNIHTHRIYAYFLLWYSFQKKTLQFGKTVSWLNLPLGEVGLELLSLFSGPCTFCNNYLWSQKCCMTNGAKPSDLKQLLFTFAGAPENS